MTPRVAANFFALKTKIPASLHPPQALQYALHHLWTSLFVRGIPPVPLLSRGMSTTGGANLSQKINVQINIQINVQINKKISIKVRKKINKQKPMKILKKSSKKKEININRKHTISIDQNQHPSPRALICPLHPRWSSIFSTVLEKMNCQPSLIKRWSQKR